MLWVISDLLLSECNNRNNYRIERKKVEWNIYKGKTFV